MTTITIADLLLEISTYFQNNPGVIAEEYDADEAETRKLLELETYCARPDVWYEENCWKDGFPPDIYNVHQFFLRDFSKLEDHNYTDEDGVKVYIHEDGTKILEFSVECH